MTMQIQSIILYHQDGRRRELAFRLGKLNVITGQSRTGKSAIIDIVDYCLGRSTFNIFEGVNRDTVAWYAVMLRVDENDVFCAKPAPRGNAASQSAAYFKIGAVLETPGFHELEVNTNDEGLTRQLSAMLGISPNLSSPGESHSRLPLEATIAHAMRSGQIMILEGEEKGGNTATDGFFDVLSADFERLDAETLALNEYHRTFPGLHDRWQILRKK